MTTTERLRTSRGNARKAILAIDAILERAAAKRTKELAAALAKAYGVETARRTTGEVIADLAALGVLT